MAVLLAASAILWISNPLLGVPDCSQSDSLMVRNAHALTYHDELQAVMLFGGADERQVRGDLWSWTGDHWKCLSTAGPPSRTFPAFTYDQAERVLVLFGGNRVLFGSETDTATFLNDMWIWKGTEGWRELDVETPSPRAEAGVAYDVDRSRIVLFGGYRIEKGETVRLGDTWEWDGTGWEQVSSDGPPPRNGTAMAYDAARKRTVLFGGNGLPRETWEWDGRKWNRSDAPETDGRFNTTMAYDPERKVTIRYGGWIGDRRIDDTWQFDGTKWTRLDVAGPPARNHTSMAYDPERGVMLLFGGHDGERVFGDTWAWNGHMWRVLGDNGARLRMDNGH